MIWLWLVLGFSWGVIMISWQKWSVDHLEQSSTLSAGAFKVLAGTLGRLIVTALILLLALRSGIWSGLALLAAFWIGRGVMLSSVIFDDE